RTSFLPRDSRMWGRASRPSDATQRTALNTCYTHLRFFRGKFMRRVLLVGFLLISLFAFAADVPKPALVALSKGTNELVIVDPTAMKAIARIPTGTGPHEVTVSADGKTAFVGNYGDRTPGNSLSVIDLAGRTEKRVDVGALKRPHGI